MAEQRIPSVPEALAALRLALHHALGCWPVRVHVFTAESAEPIPLTIPACAAQLGQREVSDASEAEQARGLSPVVLDILTVLREVKRPLSRTRLLEEMQRRGMDWAERTVAGYLARLIEDGTLDNPAEARPRGYRLAEMANREAD